VWPAAITGDVLQDGGGRCSRYLRRAGEENIHTSSGATNPATETISFTRTDTARIPGG